VRPIKGWEQVKVRQVGKNLINPAVIPSKSTNTTLDGDVLTTDFQGASRYVNKTAYKPDVYPPGIYTVTIVPITKPFSCGLFFDDATVFPQASYLRSVKIAQIEDTYTFTYKASKPFSIALGGCYTEGGTITGLFSYKLQLEAGSTATEYEPYRGEEITLDLGQTVYGGSLDWNTGLLTITKGNIESYAGENVPDGWISSTGELSTGAQVVYPIAETDPVQLTPQEILGLSGTNTLYSDTGDTDVSGKADPTSVIEKLTNAIIALGGNV
jgi:hypothetical protein